MKSAHAVLIMTSRPSEGRAWGSATAAKQCALRQHPTKVFFLGSSQGLEGENELGRPRENKKWSREFYVLKSLYHQTFAFLQFLYQYFHSPKA